MPSYFLFEFKQSHVYTQFSIVPAAGQINKFSPLQPIETTTILTTPLTFGTPRNNQSHSPASSQQCHRVQQVPPSNSTIGNNHGQRQEEGEMLPPGFWRQLADCPPAHQQIMSSTAPPMPTILNSSVSPTALLSPSNVVNCSPFSLSRSHHLTIPPAATVQQSPSSFCQAQSPTQSLLWMADLFHQATTLNGGNSVGNPIMDNNIRGGQNGQRQQPIGWERKAAAILGDTMVLKKPPPHLEERAKQMSTELLLQSPTTDLMSQRPMEEELERQRQLLFLHALSPTSPAFRQPPPFLATTAANPHQIQQQQHQIHPQFQQQQHPRHNFPVPNSPHLQPRPMVICRHRSTTTPAAAAQNDGRPISTSGYGMNVDFAAMAASVSLLLAPPPELKPEVDKAEEEEMAANGCMPDEEGEFAKMPKLEPETMEPPPLLLIEEQEMDHNNGYFAEQQHFDTPNEGPSSTVDNNQCHSPLKMPDLSTKEDEAHMVAPQYHHQQLLPPLPPLLLLHSSHPQSLEDGEAEEGTIGTSKGESTERDIVSGSSSQFSTDSSATTSLCCSSSTTSGVSSADSAILEEDELTRDVDEEGEEIKENKKVMKEEEGHRKKRKRRRRAPTLVVRKKRAKSVEHKKEVEEGGGRRMKKEKAGKKRQLTQRQNENTADGKNGGVGVDNDEEKPTKTKGQKMVGKEKPKKIKMSKAADHHPQLRLSSNWRPIGHAKNQKPLPGAKEDRLCFGEIRHRKVADVGIRLGDCVLVNSADTENDIFVGRVLAIHFEPDKRALLLTLLWFYTTRQLPVRPADAKLLDQRELFASKHLDTINADSVQGIAHVLTFAEYCRYRAELALSKLSAGYHRSADQFSRPWPRHESDFPRRDFLPKADTPPDMVFFCRGVFSIRTKRVSTGWQPKKANAKATHGLRPCRR